jgi:hypothetical protein
MALTAHCRHVCICVLSNITVELELETRKSVSVVRFSVPGIVCVLQVCGCQWKRVKRVTWGRVRLTGVWVSVEESEESYLGSCAFESTKVKGTCVCIALKYEGVLQKDDRA